MMVLHLALLLEVVLAIGEWHVEQLIMPRAIKGHILFIPNCNVLVVAVVMVPLDVISGDLKVVLLIDMFLVLVGTYAEFATIMGDMAHRLIDEIFRANETLDPHHSPAVSFDSGLAAFVVDLKNVLISQCFPPVGSYAL